MVNHWDQKHYCTKRELQSLLGTLLYVHKCVRPARTFLNRMLDLLCHAPNPSCIVLTEDFKRDLRWFKKFLPSYNGVSLFAYKNPRAFRHLKVDPFDYDLLGLTWGGTYVDT